ncbi:hypothetical protein [Haladaptatus salinisoli]|uniref:hypothetical protein n=1 Tax=Haladaptatus salinisoli TaxID=2884876 RepID=UPI001D09F4E6|nr:hypothetical protein [Haladaptatus salinisoli]
MSDRRPQTDDESCGAETDAGTPCQLDATRDDGRCHHHTDEDEKKAGRPTKLTYERQERIAAALEAGVPVKHAAPANGITEDTFYRWARRGEEQEEGEFSEFSERVTRARGVGKADLSRHVVEIAKEKGDARTLLRYLQYIDGGEETQDDENHAGLNLVVPEIAQRGDAE